MKTDELIADLADGLAPAPRRWVLTRLATGFGAGAAVSFLVMWAWLGLRPDLAQAAATSAFWMKFAYTLALAIIAFWATLRLAKPSRDASRLFVALAVVLAALLVIAAMQWMHAPPQSRMPLVMGSSARVCPWRIVLLSLPIFAGAFWSLRALGPTRLALAGAVAGLASGASGAWIYAFHCTESAAPFVLVFYTLGITVLAAAGSLIAGRALRW